MNSLNIECDPNIKIHLEGTFNDLLKIRNDLMISIITNTPIRPSDSDLLKQLDPSRITSIVFINREVIR